MTRSGAHPTIRIWPAILAAGLALFLLTARYARAGITDIPWGEYYGTVTIDGQAAPAGAVVSAVSPSGQDCGTTRVGQQSGAYRIVIQGVGDCGNLTFLVNGQKADQQVQPWHLGTSAARLDLTVTPSPSPTQSAAASAAPTPSATVSASYVQGWNLIAGPAGTTAGASGAQETLQFGDAGYDQLTPGAPLQPGDGYWAYFAQPATASLAGSSGTPVSRTVPAGQFVLVGNPFGVPAQVTGADALYVYDPINGYLPATTLQPGQGAWALSSSGSVTIAPTGG
jgi:hypothetical protein